MQHLPDRYGEQRLAGLGGRGEEHADCIGEEDDGMAAMRKPAHTGLQKVADQWSQMGEASGWGRGGGGGSLGLSRVGVSWHPMTGGGAQRTASKLDSVAPAVSIASSSDPASVARTAAAASSSAVQTAGVELVSALVSFELSGTRIETREAAARTTAIAAVVAMVPMLPPLARCAFLAVLPA